MRLKQSCPRKRERRKEVARYWRSRVQNHPDI
jgi:hypothetical protein